MEVAGPNDLPQRTPYIIAHTLSAVKVRARTYRDANML